MLCPLHASAVSTATTAVHCPSPPRQTWPPLPPPPCSLWFIPRLEAEDGAQLERSPAERAQQLADVALAVYEAGGRAIHLPLDQQHPLVAVLRAALGVGARGDLKVGR